jgi:hypothetical protein
MMTAHAWLDFERALILALVLLGLGLGPGEFGLTWAVIGLVIGKSRSRSGAKSIAGLAPQPLRRRSHRQSRPARSTPKP